MINMHTNPATAAILLIAQAACSLAIPWSSTAERLTHDPFLGRRQDNSSLDEYDFVVVGSGVGGGPTAANLAIAGYKVLLIDAGGDQGEDLAEAVPALSLLSTEFAPIEWDYYVNHHADLEEQKKDTKMVYELPDGSLYTGLTPPANAEPLGILYPRAGTLGGCSRHNALITMQAFDNDWNDIATLTGDSTWNADKMRNYWKKIEKNSYIPTSIIGHGFNGWLDTSLTSLITAAGDLKLITLIAAASTALGKSILPSLITTVTGLAGVFLSDINAPGQLRVPGVYQIPLAMRNSKRGGARDIIIDTANAVNADGSRRYQLDIKLNTLVTKVLFDESGAVPRATGVQFLEGESLYRADKRSKSASPTGSGTVSVKREVIVAGGAYNTPQLLKLSGVGPRQELESFGIPVVVDLPGVGTNLQDRYEATVIGETPSNFSLIDGCTFNMTPDDPCMVKWKTGTTQTAKGVYASNGIALGAIQKTSVAERNDPDLIITGGPAKFFGYYPGWAAPALREHNFWAWIILKGHVRNNAGTVALRSTDPRDTPVINFNSYQVGGEQDLQALREGVDYARRAFDSVIPLDGGFEEVWPGRNNVTSDAEIKGFLRNESWGHHASCSAPIGADNDPMAVLDTNFKVRGTAGLRVVDASVFPRLPGFYIAQPLYLVAEKASDVIIQAARASP